MPECLSCTVLGSSSASSSTIPINFPFPKLRLDSSPDEYTSWKGAVLGILESCSLDSHIDRRVSQPLDTNSEAYREWRQIDQVVKEVIVDALTDRLRPTVIARRTARDVWLQLEAIFTRPIATTSASATSPASASSASTSATSPSPAPASAPPPPPPPAPARQGNDAEHKKMSLELYKAALGGDWDATKAILDRDPEMAKARGAPVLNTALHIAVGTGKAISYLEKLVGYYSAHDLLALRNDHSNTPLHMAAVLGNLPAAKILVGVRRELLYMTDAWGQLPVVNAAMSGHRPTAEFFMILSTISIKINIQK